MKVLTVVLFFCALPYSRPVGYLTFPRGVGNKLQVITGFGIPLPDVKSDVTFGLIIKSNYALPTNSVQFTNPEYAFDTDSKMSRLTVYKLLELAMKRLTSMGEQCILRSICQASFTAFEEHGLVGEILKVIFLPSTTVNPDRVRRSEQLSAYEEAETIGNKAESEEACHAMYPDCSQSIMDIISTVDKKKVSNLVLSVV